MQGYGSRDQAIGFHYVKLLNAGAVEEEFQMLGCMYMKGEEIGFYVTEKESSFFQYLLSCEQKGIYYTPAILQTNWAKVAKGQRQILKRYYQFSLVEKLENIYSKSFFSKISKLQEMPSSNIAMNILTDWKNELDGCCDIDLLYLYEATISMAIQMKLLTLDGSVQLIQWVHQIEELLSGDIIHHNNKCHTYAGLAYQENREEEIRYLQFGSHYAAWKKQQELIYRGNLVSPIFVKRLYYEATDFRIIREKKAEFEKCMRLKMGGNFFERLQQLYDLPKIMPEEQYQQMLLEVNNYCSNEEKMAFILYSSKLRMQ